MGERPVDVVHMESFGKTWYSDIKSHLKLKDVNEVTAPYGQLPDLSKTNKVSHMTDRNASTGVCRAASTSCVVTVDSIQSVSKLAQSFSSLFL